MLTGVLLSACRGVLGHTEHPQGNNWLTVDEQVTADLAAIVGTSPSRAGGEPEVRSLTELHSITGAKPAEVACMGSLTANLHAMLTSFYRPTATRHKILYEGKAFPSDSVRPASPSSNFLLRD